MSAEGKAAQEAFKAGLYAASAGNHQEALDHFLSSNEIQSKKITLFNIAKAYENLGDSENAEKYKALASPVGDELTESAIQSRDALNKEEHLMKARRKFDAWVEDKHGRPPVTDKQWEMFMDRYPEQLKALLEQTKEG